MMQELKLVHRGFIYSREKRQWENGNFAILTPTDKDEYEHPTEGKYGGYLWLALWDGVWIAQGTSLHKAITRIEDEGYIPAFDEESEGALELVHAQGADINDDDPSTRYVDGFPAHCNKCDGVRAIAGYITAPSSKKSDGRRRGHGWQVTGKCTACRKGVHVTIKKELEPLIPESVKTAAFLAAGIPAAFLDAGIG